MQRNAVTRFTSRVALVACMMLPALALCAGAVAAEKKGTAQQWYKGDIHCHTLWSDGNSFPEWTVDWYQSHGFQFLALTDHNTFQEGERWVKVGPKKGKGLVSQESYDKAKEKFGAQMVEQTSGTQKVVRLKTFEPLSQQFNVPGKFLLIPGEEITTDGPKGTGYRVHSIVMNMASKVTEPAFKKDQKNAGTWMANTMARQIEALRKETGRSIHGHLNHPLWSHLKPEDIVAVRGFNQMEISNESPQDKPKMEQVWDAVLADRVKNGKPLMLGVAVDDAHNHLNAGDSPAIAAGCGWIAVRAAALTAENIVKAIERGNFYASCGTELLDVRRGKTKMSLKIKPEEGVTYKTEFIGMREGGQPGEVLATSNELNPAYTIKGDELYVRAKVTSSREFKNAKGEVEYPASAWTQPYQPKKMK